MSPVVKGLRQRYESSPLLFFVLVFLLALPFSAAGA